MTNLKMKVKLFLTAVMFFCLWQSAKCDMTVVYLKNGTGYDVNYKISTSQKGNHTLLKNNELKGIVLNVPAQELWVAYANKTLTLAGSYKYSTVIEASKLENKFATITVNTIPNFYGSALCTVTKRESTSATTVGSPVGTETTVIPVRLPFFRGYGNSLRLEYTARNISPVYMMYPECLISFNKHGFLKGVKPLHLSLLNTDGDPIPPLCVIEFSPIAVKTFPPLKEIIKTLSIDLLDEEQLGLSNVKVSVTSCVYPLSSSNFYVNISEFNTLCKGSATSVSLFDLKGVVPGRQLPAPGVAFKAQPRLTENLLGCQIVSGFCSFYVSAVSEDSKNIAITHFIAGVKCNEVVQCFYGNSFLTSVRALSSYSKTLDPTDKEVLEHAIDSLKLMSGYNRLPLHFF